MSDLRPPRYLKPMNSIVKAMQKLSIPTGPAMVLTVPGRKTGRPRSTPMTPFTYRGGLYTVAGYPGADWAANARAAGVGTLSRGRKSRKIMIVELGAVGSLPGAGHAAWGEAIGYCEGVRVVFDGERRHGEILRVPDEHRLIEN